MRLLVLIGLLLFQGNMATARECDFSTRSAVESAQISYDAFLEQRRGAIAIGEGDCTPANICSRYLVITGCSRVTYVHPPGDANNPLSIAFNTVAHNCGTVNACADTVLHAAMMFDDSADPAPSLDLFRRSSERWKRTYGVDTRGGYLETFAGMTSLKAFLKATISSTSWRTLVDLGMRWHSSFQRKWDGRYVATWDSRRHVIDDDELVSCEPACSIKMYLIKFEESPVRPTVALRFSGNTSKFPTMRLRTWAAAEGSVYTRRIDFTFVQD